MEVPKRKPQGLGLTLDDRTDISPGVRRTAKGRIFGFFQVILPASRPPQSLVDQLPNQLPQLGVSGVDAAPRPQRRHSQERRIVRGPGGELAEQRDDGRPVEEAPERIGDQRRESAARFVTDIAPAVQTACHENRRRAEGEIRDQLGEIRRPPGERLQVDREQIVDVRAEDVRIRLRERLVVRHSGKLAVTPRPQEGRQFRIQQERRGPFPPIVDAPRLRIRQPGIRK